MCQLIKDGGRPPGRAAVGRTSRPGRTPPVPLSYSSQGRAVQCPDIGERKRGEARSNHAQKHVDRYAGRGGAKAPSGRFSRVVPPFLPARTPQGLRASVGREAACMVPRSTGGLLAGFSALCPDPVVSQVTSSPRGVPGKETPGITPADEWSESSVTIGLSAFIHC